MHDASSNSLDSVWKLSPQAQIHWKHWDEGYVVFNEQSGDTHLLDVVGREGLLCLQHSTLTPVQLSSQLAQRLDIENDSNLLQYTEQLIATFDKLGLLERENL